MTGPNSSYLHISPDDLESIATSLEDTAAGLHSHADTFAAMGIPGSAFGASVHLAEAVEAHRLELEQILRSSGTEAQGHAAGARETSAAHQALSAERAAHFNSIRAE